MPFPDTDVHRSLEWALRPAVRFEPPECETDRCETGEKAMSLVGPAGTVPLGRPRPAVVRALGRLEHGAPLGELTAIASDGGWEALPELYALLDRMAACGLLTWTLRAADAALATLCSAAGETLRWRTVDPQRRVRLSRFACLRAKDGEIRLESPRSPFSMRLRDRRAVALAGDLSRPTSAAEIAAAETGMDLETATALVSLLATGGYVVFPDDDATNGEEQESEWYAWEFHDLLFHARTRGPRHRRPTGGTFRFRGRFPAPPVAAPLPEDGGIELERPDMQALEAGDRSLTWVLEHRRSRRRFDGAPLEVRQLGEFLYRTARQRGVRRGRFDAVSDRPYPSAGARHALEIYPVVRQCQGLEPGLYHYAARKHRLHRVRSMDREVEALAAAATPDPASAGLPPVALVIAARFQRTQWAYESIAYALILKDTGVLLQTMYLVATAMGLTGCAVGWGDSELFARCAGTAWGAETSVGEFVLGGAARST